MPAPVLRPVPALVGLDALRDQLRQLHPRVAAITIAERTRSDHERHLGRVALDDEAVRAALGWTGSRSTRTTRAPSAADRNRVTVRAIHDLTWHKLVGPAPRRFRVRLYGHYSDQALVSLSIELRRADGEALSDPAPPPPPRSPDQEVHDAHVQLVALVQATTATITQMQEGAISRLSEELETTRAHAAELDRQLRAAEREDLPPPPSGAQRRLKTYVK